MAEDDDTPTFLTPFGFLLVVAIVCLIAFGYYYLIYRGAKAVYQDVRKSRGGRPARPSSKFRTRRDEN